jgi:uncharacterized membrane protein
VDSSYVLKIRNIFSTDQLSFFLQLQRKLGPRSLLDMTRMIFLTLASSIRKADALRNGAQWKTLSLSLALPGLMGLLLMWMLF